MDCDAGVHVAGMGMEGQVLFKSFFFLVSFPSGSLMEMSIQQGKDSDNEKRPVFIICQPEK